VTRPLKKIKQDGTLYQRIAPIEALLDKLIILPSDVLIEKCKSINPKDADYIPSECLVYLIRESLRNENEKLCNTLLPILLGRCQKILVNKISNQKFSDATQLRHEILGKFSELFATDCWLSEEQDLLDYYEVRFNHAFQSLRINNIRTESKDLEKKYSESVEVKEEKGALQDYFKEHDLIDKVELLPQEKLALLNQIWCFISVLPEVERNSLILYYADGLTQDAIATITGVTERTVRNRLNQGINTIKNKMED